MEKDDLQYIYKEEYADIYEYNNGMGELIWMDLEYVENGKTIKVKAFPLFDISSFADLDYYQEYWQAHKVQVYKWLDWFQKYISRKMDVDKEWWIRENEQERWDNDEIDKEEYEDFDEWWSEYEGSDSYWEEVSWIQQTQWEDLQREFEYEFKVIDDVVRGDWFDSYNRLNTYKMDEDLDEAIKGIEGLVEYFLRSAYEPSDFTYEELKDHLDWIFK